MPTQESRVIFYDFSGPIPSSPCCWWTRYSLNFKGISYTTIKVPFQDIKATCKKLLGDMTGLEFTVPIIEIFGPGTEYKALNDLTPIAELLEEKFPASKGYKFLKNLDKVRQYEKDRGILISWIFRWIVYDAYKNSVDKHDGSLEFFKRTREESTGCALQEITEVVGGGEENVMRELRKCWGVLRDRMKKEDGIGEPTYIDFWDAGNVMWVKATSPEKYEMLKGSWKDDTFVKLMKKIEKYSYAE